MLQQTPPPKGHTLREDQLCNSGVAVSTFTPTKNQHQPYPAALGHSDNELGMGETAPLHV